MTNNKAAFGTGLNGSGADASLAPFDRENRKKMIEVAAYFRAEKRGFLPNNELADWFDAEAEINRHLNSFSS